MDVNNKSLIEHIKYGVLTNRWKNGEAGRFYDFDNNLLYRFCQTDENLKAFLLPIDEQRKLPILICGFVAWLIKYWGSDSGKIYSSYLDMRIRQYEESQKTAPDILSRNLTQEFFKSYIDDEQSWIKQSESVYEYVTDEDAVIIQQHIKYYLEYVEEQ